MPFTEFPVATSAFTGFAFPATGSPTSRTMPTRLAEVKNVKDFGATGNGVTDDRNAIQACLDWTTGNRGIIFFPPGIYVLNSSVTFNEWSGAVNAHFVGCGDASRIEGNFAGYLIDRNITEASSRGGTTFENLQFRNYHTGGGCIRMLSHGGLVFKNLFISAANTGITLYNGIFDCLVDSCVFSHYGTYSNTAVGLYGVPNPNAIVGCGFFGWGEGLRLRVGGAVIGCRFEVNGVGIMAGRDENGATYPCSSAIINCGMEGNYIGIHANSFVNSAIIATSIQGQDFAPQPGGGIGNSLHALLVHHFSNSMISSLSAAGQFSSATIKFDEGPVSATCIGINPTNAIGGGLWSLPADTSGIDFINCKDVPDHECTFAELKSTLPQKTIRFVSNSNTATLGAKITGTGANRVAAMKIIGSNVWIVIGVSV